ncbi:MAG: hypothetical protein Q4D62_15065 [Planctomycetia bacterium]|nr:hypothetical protein [Planctomycetia bacterium]
MQKIYNPTFSGILSPQKQTADKGQNPTWELTGAFVMEEPDFEIEICAASNATDVRKEFGVGERFKVNAVIKNETPRYRGELAIKSIQITRNGKVVKKSTIELINRDDYIYQIYLASYSSTHTEENRIRSWKFDLEVKVDVSGQEYVKNTSITVYSPKLVSDQMEPHDFRVEQNEEEMYGIGFKLKDRKLLPKNVSYDELWFQEGECVGETSGICNYISNTGHVPLKAFKIGDSEGMGIDDCCFYLPKSVFLVGTEGTWSWKIPQRLSFSQNGNYVTFAYLTQAFSCKVIGDEVIDETIAGVHYVRQLTVRFTLSKNEHSHSVTEVIKYTAEEL